MNDYWKRKESFMKLKMINNKQDLYRPLVLKFEYFCLTLIMRLVTVLMTISRSLLLRVVFVLYFKNYISWKFLEKTVFINEVEVHL